MATKHNKVLTEVTAIEEAMQEELGGCSMDNEDDRARMAWWIHQTFSTGDFRDKLHIIKTNKERRSRDVTT